MTQLLVAHMILKMIHKLIQKFDPCVNTHLNYTCLNATYVQREEKFLGLFMTGFPQREALVDQCERMRTQVVSVCLGAW